MILECGGVCKASMGIIFKLLCPGDVPAKAHKLILNTTTTNGYEEYCHEKHYAEVVYDLWDHDYNGWRLLNKTTNELIERTGLRVWGQYDKMPHDWEFVQRELLLNNCIKFTKYEN